MAEPWLIYFFACNREMQPFSFFLLAIRWGGGGDLGSGSGSKFNRAARVGSGWVRQSRVRAGFGLQFWARADLYNNIRKEIGTCSSYAEVTQIRLQLKKKVTMCVFEAIDSKILEEIVQHLKSSTCYTHFPHLFSSVLICLEADLLEVVNASLLSLWLFQTPWKLLLLSPSEKAQSS